MRIAIASFKFDAATNGGASTLVGELARAFKRSGHEVMVATSSDAENKTEVVDGILVERRKFVYKFPNQLAGSHFALLNYCLELSLDFYSSVEEAIRLFNPDVIEVPESYALGLGFAIAREYPVVVRCVCPGYLLAESGEIGTYSNEDKLLTSCLELALVGGASGLISISRSLALDLSQRSAIPLDRFEIIPVPLTPPALIPANNGAGGNKGSRHSPNLLYWGRVEQQKGCDILIEALPKVAAVFPNFRLYMAGSVSQLQGQDKPYSYYLKERLRELGLENNVEFTGFLSVQDLESLIARADICVLPSKYESAGYTAIEAMARGKCVLTTSAGGLPEYVTHLKSGYLVPPYSHEDLSEAIVLLARDEVLRQRLANNARDSVLSICDVKTVADRSLEVFSKAIQNFKVKNECVNYAIPKIAEDLQEALQISMGDSHHLTNKALMGAYEQGLRAARELNAAEGISKVYRKTRSR